MKRFDFIDLQRNKKNFRFVNKDRHITRDGQNAIYHAHDEI